MLLKNRSIFYNAAKAFGRFQKLLADFPADKLHETIKDFHNTPKRFADFEKAITNNISGRADKGKKEIEFALKKEKHCVRNNRCNKGRQYTSKSHP